MISEIIPIWKPVNCTSFDVVKNVRDFIGFDKVGHAGTLDPFAEGLLMICTGSKTKDVERVMDQKKEYIAEIKLGSETDSLDSTGTVIYKKHIPKISNKQIMETLSHYKGEIMQRPPSFSALKINGIPLYKLARKDIFIHLKERKITIYDIQLISYLKDIIKLKIICVRGTYIRTLARDISRSLNTVGYLDKLIRTKIGDYSIDESIKIEDLGIWLSAKI